MITRLVVCIYYNYKSTPAVSVSFILTSCSVRSVLYDEWSIYRCDMFKCVVGR